MGTKDKDLRSQIESVLENLNLLDSGKLSEMKFNDKVALFDAMVNAKLKMDKAQSELAVGQDAVTLASAEALKMHLESMEAEDKAGVGEKKSLKSGSVT